MVSKLLILAAPILLACQSLAVFNREIPPGLLIPGTKVKRRKYTPFDMDNDKLSYKATLRLDGQDVLVEIFVGGMIEWARLDLIESEFFVFGPDCKNCPNALMPYQKEEGFEASNDSGLVFFSEGGCHANAGYDMVYNPEGSVAYHQKMWIADECMFPDGQPKSFQWGAIMALGIPMCKPHHAMPNPNKFNDRASSVFRIEGEGLEEVDKSDETHPPHARDPHAGQKWHQRMAAKERQRRNQQAKKDAENHTFSAVGGKPDHPLKPDNMTEEEFEKAASRATLANPVSDVEPMPKTHAVGSIHNEDCKDWSILDTWAIHSFSICMAAGHSAYGSLSINPADETHNPKITKLYLAGNRYWAFKIRNLHLRLGGMEFGETLGCNTGKGCVALLDVTSPILGVTSGIAKKMEKIWKENMTDCHDMSLVPELAFKGGSSTEDAQYFRLSASAWLSQAYGRTTAEVAGIENAPVEPHDYPGPKIGCDLIIQDIGEAMTDQGPMIVLGQPMFTHYVMGFHNEPGSERFVTAQHAKWNCDPVPFEQAPDAEWASFAREPKAGLFNPDKLGSARERAIPRYVPSVGQILKV